MVEQRKRAPVFHPSARARTGAFSRYNITFRRQRAKTKCKGCREKSLHVSGKIPNSSRDGESGAGIHFLSVSGATAGRGASGGFVQAQAFIRRRSCNLASRLTLAEFADSMILWRIIRITREKFPTDSAAISRCLRITREHKTGRIFRFRKVGR
jgi:hypothetical protein